MSSEPLQPSLSEVLESKDKIKVEVTLSSNKSNLQVRTWLASKDIHGERHSVQTGVSSTVDIKISEEAVLEHLCLIVELKSDDNQQGYHFVGELKIGYREIISKAFSNGDAHTVAIADYKVEIFVKNVNRINSGQLHRLRTVPEETYEDRKRFLDTLFDLAAGWKGRKGIAIFRKFFGPSLEITLEAYELGTEKIWMKGHVDNLVAGPGIVYALHMIVALFAFYCLVLLIFGFVLLPGCLQDSIKVTGVCLFPLTFYIIYVIGAWGKLYFELAVMGCILPPKVMLGGVPYIFPGFDSLFSSESAKAMAWMVIKVIGSAATSLDIFSGSIFLARVRATNALTKDFSWTMEDAWMRSLQESPWFHQVRFLGYPTFVIAVWVTWLSVLLQLLFALAYSVPLSGELQPSRRSPQKVWYDFRPPIMHTNQYIRKKMLSCLFCEDVEKLEFGQSPEGCDDFVDYAEYSTLLIRHQVHGRALTALLKSGRMSMALSNDTEYVTQVVQNWKPKEIVNYQQQMCGFFTVFMLQRLLTISLQASFAGITKNLNHGTSDHVDWISFMNVLLGCGMGFATVCDEVRLSSKMTMRVFSRASQMLEGTETKQEKFQMKNDKIWTVLNLLYTLLFALVSIAFLGYAVLKAIKVNNCECGLWNVHFVSLLSARSIDEIGYCVTFEDHCRMNSTWIDKTRPERILAYDLMSNVSVSVPPGVCWALGFPS